MSSRTFLPSPNKAPMLCVVNDSKGSATSNTIRLIDFTLGEKKPVYRALLIGEEDFYPICERNRGDVNHFANMLGKASAPGGTKYKVYYITANDESMIVKAVYGPWEA